MNNQIGDLTIEVSLEQMELIENDENYRNILTNAIIQSSGNYFGHSSKTNKAEASFEEENVENPTIESGSGYFGHSSKTNKAEASFEEENVENPTIESGSGYFGHSSKTNRVEATFDDTNSAEWSKVVWLEAPTKMLLALVDEMSPHVGKTFSLKNKKKMWQAISQKLAAEGYAFSPSQVQCKFRTLERQYKKKKVHNTKTGRDRQNCAFQSELDKIMAKKRGVFPEFVLDEAELEGTSRETLMTNAGMGLETQASDSGENFSNSPSASTRESTPTNKRLKASSLQEQILQQVSEMRKERSEYYQERLKHLKLKREQDERRVKILETIQNRLLG